MTLRGLERMFREERQAFGRRYPGVRGAALAIFSKPSGLRFRDMAFVETGRGRRPLVGLYREALGLPAANLRGLIRHELGHVAAPGRGEQAADDAAERVTGRKIRYDARRVQTVGRGRWPRPRSLHR